MARSERKENFFLGLMKDYLKDNSKDVFDIALIPGGRLVEALADVQEAKADKIRAETKILEAKALLAQGVVELDEEKITKN